MSKTDQAPLKLTLKHSKRLNKLMILMHALALLASVMNSLPTIVKFALLIEVCVHGYFELKRLNNQQYGIEHTEIGWQLAKDNEFIEIQILPSTVISIVAIFLHFKTANNTKGTLVIFNDALEKDDYRSLIVRLKTTIYDKPTVA